MSFSVKDRIECFDDLFLCSKDNFNKEHVSNWMKVFIYTISTYAHGQDLVKYLSTSMDEVTNWFNQYQVDSIELSISGAIETGSVLKLVVSVKGEGGLKVILKPKPV